MWHKLKSIQFFGRQVPIILQNDNGPCPLIAICNVLLLRNQLTLSLDWGEVSQEKLLSLLAERLIDANSNVKNKDAGYVETQQLNIDDAIDLLPRLATGINVNLKFTRIDDFDFTGECAIFDLLDIPLCHGWIADPQDSDTASSIGCKSYNTLMGELVALDTEIRESHLDCDNDCVDFAAAATASLSIPPPSLSSNADETKGKSGFTPRQGHLIRKFLKNNANQLTKYGLFCLQEGLKEREICVFFRNNHFNTMFKYEGELYLLVTDQGYLRQPYLVWEKLDEVNGNTEYMTGSFNAENPKTRSWDEQIAISNYDEYIASINDGAEKDASFSSNLRLAIALQQQEFEQQPQQWQQQQPQCSVPHPNTSREKGLVTGPQTNEALNLVKTNQSKNSNIPKASLEETMVGLDIVTRHTNILESFIEHKTEIVRRIKQAEDIAQIKEAEIEREFEKIYEKHMVMKKHIAESQMELTKGKLKQAQEKLKMVSEKELKQAQEKLSIEMKLIKGELNKEMEDMETEKKLKEANKKLKGAYDLKNLGQELETDKKLKEKLQAEMTIDIRMKVAHLIKLREQEESDIMEKTIKMMQAEDIMKEVMEAEDIMKKVLEAKNSEKIKEAQIIKRIKNMIEAEYLERMVVEISRKELSELLNIEKFKESEGTNTFTMAAGSTSRTKHYKTDDVRIEACKLVKTSLERCDFKISEHQALIVSRQKGEDGDYDYACGNVMRIWPKLKKKGTKFQGPRHVGSIIMRSLMQSDMIEGTPSLHKFGIVTFKISRKWRAKTIHKMLIEGIETWAPNVPFERAIVDHPSLDIVEEMHMDMLRRRYISRSLTRMLQYCQVHVLNSAREAGHMDLAAHVIEIEERDGEVLIHNKAKGELKLLLKRKSDRGLSNVFKDLGALWYGVKKLNAQRLLYVTHVAKQEYIETCFTAAKSAKWLSSIPLEPPCAIYVGYQSCTTKMEKLLSILNEAKALHKVGSFVLRGNAANYTARDVIECCIQYTLLKTHRMADCTFGVDEILDEEGNTFLYLLNTQARIRSITDKSRMIIRKLIEKEALEKGILEKDDLLEKGEERELGLHILNFTEVLRQSCSSLLPHNLCKYLYKLSKIFNRYLVSNYARGKRSFFLLLCEATAVVMEKCFHLLDLAPQSFKNELGVTGLMYGAQLLVERPINVKEVEGVNAPCVGRDPPKIHKTRFEPFSLSVDLNPDFEQDLTPVKLFGYIDVIDTCGLRSDGWVSTHRADASFVHLFRHHWSDPLDIINGGCTPFGDPSCSHSVPFSSSMQIAMNLVATNEEENDFVTICNMDDKLDFSEFLASDLQGSCGYFAVKSAGGRVRINYILLKDAVDATFKVTLKTSLKNTKVYGSIYAYYVGGFFEECDDIKKTFYTAQLFQIDSPRILKGGPIPLKKSRMAVPWKGSSLKVVAHLRDGKSYKVILEASCIFSAKTNGSNTKYLEGPNCSLEVKVNWSR